LSIGVIAAETAWRAVGPFIGTARPAPPVRTLLAMSSIFGSAALLAALGNFNRDTTPTSYWVDAIGACLVGQAWIAFKTFALLTAGRPAKVMRLSVLVAHLVAGTALLALMVSVVLSRIDGSQFRVLTMTLAGVASMAMAWRLRREYADGFIGK
jgi:hypothetical protein